MSRQLTFRSPRTEYQQESMYRLSKLMDGVACIVLLGELRPRPTSNWRMCSGQWSHCVRGLLCWTACMHRWNNVWWGDASAWNDVCRQASQLVSTAASQRARLHQLRNFLQSSRVHILRRSGSHFAGAGFAELQPKGAFVIAVCYYCLRGSDGLHCRTDNTVRRSVFSLCAR